jgi:hypothetical protein
MNPGVLAPEGTFGPLGQAVDESAGNVVITLSIMVQIVSWLLPWALLASLAWILPSQVGRLLRLGRQRQIHPNLRRRADGIGAPS